MTPVEHAKSKLDDVQRKIDRAARDSNERTRPYPGDPIWPPGSWIFTPDGRVVDTIYQREMGVLRAEEEQALADLRAAEDAEAQERASWSDPEKVREWEAQRHRDFRQWHAQAEKDLEEARHRWRLEQKAPADPDPPEWRRSLERRIDRFFAARLSRWENDGQGLGGWEDLDASYNAVRNEFLENRRERALRRYGR